jgi:hypothetical protein
MALKTVYTAHDEFTALSIRDMLAFEGIQSIIRNNELPMFGGMTFLSGPWGEIWVEDEDFERAAELIGGFLGSLGELAEAEEEGEEGESPQ